MLTCPMKDLEFGSGQSSYVELNAYKFQCQRVCKSKINTHKNFKKNVGLQIVFFLTSENINIKSMCNHSG